MSDRANFTGKTKTAAHKRSAGICECHLIPHVFKTACRQPLVEGRIRYEHINVDHNSKDNSLENCATLRIECWRYKTDHYDKRIISKTKKQHRGAIGAKTSRHPMPGGRRSRFKHKMDGSIQDRLTGKLIRGPRRR